MWFILSLLKGNTSFLKTFLFILNFCMQTCHIINLQLYEYSDSISSVDFGARFKPGGDEKFRIFPISSLCYEIIYMCMARIYFLL